MDGMDGDLRAQDNEPELHVVTAAALDQHPVLVIEEEHPLQVRPRRHPGVTAIGRRSSVKNSTGIARKVGPNNQPTTHSDQTVTRSTPRRRHPHRNGQ
jgi:hypothetical protein